VHSLARWRFRSCRGPRLLCPPLRPHPLSPSPPCGEGGRRIGP